MSGKRARSRTRAGSSWRQIAPIAAVVALLAVGALYLMTPKAAAPVTGIDDVTLVSDTNATVQWRALAGEPRIVFFGFTHCPELCPTTIAALDGAVKQVKAAPAPRIYFISVDPERDTPAALHAYLASFGGHVTALTGPPDEIARVATAFGVRYEKVPLGDGDYTLSHTSSVFLLDSTGAIVRREAYDAPPATMARAIGALMAR